MAVYEVLIPDEEFRAAVLERRSTADIKMLARRKGMQTMHEAGIRKVLRGMTTVEEMLRVVHADEPMPETKSS
jgi:type II secretory ATPase GspE/PulE/Tfp pilus assembly ATPase PilB-like protein